jgi:phosphatidylserine/phosphatidylglycerophosphate/cardiolipin synthase-like enzyme
MAKFLTTNGINYLVEEIIKTGKERVILVSPYLKLNARIKELLSDGYRPDVDIRIVYGKRDLDPSERQWLRTVPHIRTSFCQNLHAKCYLNESLCVISSLNLHQFSQQNNNEMGVMITRASDHQLYADVTSEVERLLRISEPTHEDRENLVFESSAAAPPKEIREDYAKLTTARLAARLGMKTRLLVDKLVGCGFVQIQNGQKRLTGNGKRAGGEEKFSTRKGEFIVWPSDLQV